eukprot:CAMPEP_0197257792 /NCGR_PEP_ID=MMETSP1429-20130617/79965_1 /TAXON_ID=49237 /ORGANISM="Chaetoceros  sp., Strain UNC1202" /LENGTH=74 /DNA_ID=CAMNT_0042721731 /DNA_START=92 /DNA_END=313 /DNA_ORIENTATION=+
MAKDAFPLLSGDLLERLLKKTGVHHYLDLMGEDHMRMSNTVIVGEEEVMDQGELAEVVDIAEIIVMIGNEMPIG